MGIDEILADAERGEEVLPALREWLSTEEGGTFLLSVLGSALRPAGIFSRRRRVLAKTRVVVPATMHPLGEQRSALLGLPEDELSDRELALVDEVHLEWADWDPVRRVLSVSDGVGITVPDHLPLAQAALSLIAAQAAAWPEHYLANMENE